MATDKDDDNPFRLADADLWRRIADGVRPLPRGGTRPGAPASPPAEPAAKTPEAPPRRARAETRQPAPPATPPVELGPSVLRHGAAAGLDKRTLARLRRGLLPIESTIDLHGMTQPEAYRSLHQFIAVSHERGRRCVLVITGKGARSEGVLRAAVPHWLNLPGTRNLVLAFAYATPAHGGMGALYVLIKRRRPPMP